MIFSHFFTCVTGNIVSNIMPTPSTSRPTSSSLSRDMLALSGSFRSSSPTHSIQIEHPIPNHPHIHIHTVRSTMTPPNSDIVNNKNAVYDDDILPPSSISAQVLAPFLNGPMPSTFTAASLHQNLTVSTNGLGRGAIPRANALGSSSRSSSVRRSRRRRSNEDNSLVAEYLELIGEGQVDTEKLEKIRHLASERGVPSQLRRVKCLLSCIDNSTSGLSFSHNLYDKVNPRTLTTTTTTTSRRSSQKYQNGFGGSYRDIIVGKTGEHFHHCLWLPLLHKIALPIKNPLFHRHCLQLLRRLPQVRPLPLFS